MTAIGTASGFQCALIRKPTAKHSTNIGGVGNGNGQNNSLGDGRNGGTNSGKKKPKPHFSRCKSPKTYKHLKPGRYTFLVRAVSAGIPGTAASKNFKIS